MTVKEMVQGMPEGSSIEFSCRRQFTFVLECDEVNFRWHIGPMSADYIGTAEEAAAALEKFLRKR